MENQGQPAKTAAPNPARGLRAGALLVSGVIAVGGSLLVLFGMGTATDARVAASWALVQFIAGVWAGVLGANSPFLHGLVVGLPPLVLGLVVPSTLPAQYVIVTWFLAPCAALVAAATMRFLRRRH